MNLSTFLDLLSVIGIIALLLVTGYICRRVRIIDDAASNRLSALIIKLGQPMMIIGALISKEYSREKLITGLTFMLIGFLLHPFMALLAHLSGPLYKDLNEKKISLFATIFTNCGFIGFPILEAIFPGEGAFVGAFFVIGFHVYFWTLGIAILAKGRDDIKLTPRKAIINLGTVPCVIGLSLYMLQSVVTLPTFVVQFTNHLGNLCLPITVLITGALIARQGLPRMFGNPRIYLFNAIKLLGVPLITAFAAKLVTLWMAPEAAYDIVLFCTVIAALPCGASITMLGELYGIDPEYAAGTVGTSSVLCVGTLPLVYFLGDLIAKWAWI